MLALKAKLIINSILSLNVYEVMTQLSFIWYTSCLLFFKIYIESMNFYAIITDFPYTLKNYIKNF